VLSIKKVIDGNARYPKRINMKKCTIYGFKKDVLNECKIIKVNEDLLMIFIENSVQFFNFR
jgi:hypothetical protein